MTRSDTGTNQPAGRGSGNGNSDGVDQRRPLIAGIVAMCLAGFMLAAMDGLHKHLMQTLNPVQVVWARYTVQTVLVGLVLAAQGHHHFIRPRRPLLQLGRGATLLGVTVCMYIALQQVPLAEATAIMFFAPVLLTLMAGPLLGETVQRGHWLAVGLGFAGVLAVVQPGFKALDPYLLLPLCAALFLSLYFALTRKLRQHDRESTTQFHTTFFGAVSMCALVPFFWQSLSLQLALLLLVGGTLGTLGHFLVVKAFHLAPASSLSPFTYVHLLAATIYSIWWFGDAPDVGFWIGAGMIVMAGLLVWRMEAAKRR